MSSNLSSPRSKHLAWNMQMKNFDSSQLLFKGLISVLPEREIQEMFSN